MTKNKLTVLLFALSLFISCKEIAFQKTHSTLVFESLTCNSKTNPRAIEHNNPLFSWVINAKGYNKQQSNYHILVASSLENLNEKDADLWNSGNIASNQSTFVKYKGEKLEAMRTYFWKVKVWDQNQEVSKWSSHQQFKMGLLSNSNWEASKWITLQKDTRTSKHSYRDYKTGGMKTPIQVNGFAAGYFRNTLSIDKKVVDAEAYICGLGYYELYLNGKKVGDHVLDPAPSNYDKQAYYVNYNITEALKSGKNAVGIILGNGFYGQNISWKRDPESQRDLAYGSPTVKLLVKLKYADGTTSSFYTNENWKATTGPIVFNNIYGGDTYDARFELGNWGAVDYDDANWGGVKVANPKLKKISAQQIPAIKKIKEFDPKKVFKAPDGNWIVDFGQNIAGWVKINVNEPKDKLIEIITTEALTKNGKDIFQGSTGGGANGMAQVYKYISKGSGLATWEPKFSYHGFRYAKIKGISNKPNNNTIKAVLVATDVKETGRFSSSDTLLNKMHSISKWTIIDNLHGIPEDCPHREKCGWLGDAHAFCEYALYNYDMYDFYKKFMEDIRTQMRPTKGHNNPKIKFQVPTMIAPGKRTSTYAKLDWGIATMYLPWYNYLYYGDDTIVKEYYKDMKELTNFYLSFKDENGIIQNGMGDWCPPRWDRKRNPSAMQCDPVISANAYFYDILGVMESFSKINNDASFKAKILKEKQDLKVAFNKIFLVSIPNTNHKWYASQTATVQALQFDLVPDSEIENVVNGLAYDITEVKAGHHNTGIHGNRYIYTVLSKYGKAELAHQILTTPSFPSQTYVMNSGFTTWPERQFEWELLEAPSNSLNHPMHSGFAAYFYESLGGVKSSYENPGFKVFTVNPKFSKNITSTKVSVPTPYGNINNSWNIEGSKLIMNLEIPFNTKGEVILSEHALKSLNINGVPFKVFQDLQDVQVIDNTTLRLGSGNYILKYSNKAH